jgi:DNA-binding transcriptional ArsR family regulator
MLRLAAEFKECRTAITALGDETRQEIIVALLEVGCGGMRVGDITEKTRLSRPAVSHHLQILKDTGIIAMRREGTMNFYYMDANETRWGRMTLLMEHVNELVKAGSEKHRADACRE